MKSIHGTLKTLLTIVTLLSASACEIKLPQGAFQQKQPVVVEPEAPVDPRRQVCIPNQLNRTVMECQRVDLHQEGILEAALCNEDGPVNEAETNADTMNQYWAARFPQAIEMTLDCQYSAELGRCARGMWVLVRSADITMDGCSVFNR